MSDDWGGLSWGILKAAITDGAKFLVGRSKCKISISYPRAHERPNDVRTVSKIKKECKVRGTLNFLKKDHLIWLLTEDAEGHIWPQAWGPPQYNEKTKEWEGSVIVDIKKFKIYAVVAPPTTIEFFQYYEAVGQASGYRPINRLPPECQIQDSMQVVLS